MGEQKGLLLSVALAVFRMCLRDQDLAAHFLLLDEGMAHLDSEKSAWLWDELLSLGGYVIVTGTEGILAPKQVQHWVLP